MNIYQNKITLREGVDMGAKIYESNYKDQKCLAMESEKLIVKVIPNSGGKIQCIYDKEGQKELLYQSPWEKYRVSAYDTSYGEGEFSGFDEMFPAISEGYYPSGPWKGARVPDHGEVWSIPWSVIDTNACITLEVYGVRFPYRLRRKIEFSGEKGVRLSYTAENLSDFDFEFIWAAHPLFNCSENTVIVLPESVSSVINTEPSVRMGGYGRIHPWPITQTPEGEMYDMTRVAPESSRFYEKYYVYGKMQEGWCGLQDTKTGRFIKLSFPVDVVPYLGMWINEGGLAGEYNIAPEPCTGAPDRIDTAKQWGQAAVIAPKSEYGWHLSITVG